MNEYKVVSKENGTYEIYQNNVFIQKARVKQI